MATLRLLRRRRPFALVAALVAIVPMPVWALIAGEPVGIYGALAVLLPALTAPPLLLAEIAARVTTRRGSLRAGGH